MVEGDYDGDATTATTEGLSNGQTAKERNARGSSEKAAAKAQTMEEKKGENCRGNRGTELA